MGKKSMLLKLMLAVVMFGAATFTASASNGYSKEYNVLAANGSFTIVITGNNVIGRDGPAGYDTGIRFNKGNRLTCISRSGSWYQVVYGNRYLWVSTLSLDTYLLKKVSQFFLNKVFQILIWCDFQVRICVT